MKKYIYILSLLLGILFSGCEGFDLPRDNPLDSKNNVNPVKGVSVKYYNHKVVSDDNNDGIINKGETVYLKVELKNEGKKTAESVKAFFKIENQYISEIEPTYEVNYGDINAGGTANGSIGYAPGTFSVHSLKFKVSESTPDNTEIPIILNISDGNGNSWIDTLTITVEAVKSSIAYESYNIVADDNGDEIINKGETVYLKVNLKNNGTSSAKAVKATFSCDNQFVSELEPTYSLSYGDINAGSTAYGTAGYAPGTFSVYSLKFKVSESTPDNTEILININITDDNGNSWSSKFVLVVYPKNSKIDFDSFDIVSDNNNDNTINKGETIYLKVNLKNIGTSSAKTVKAVFSSDSPYISELEPTYSLSYGDINAGSSTYGTAGYAPGTFSVYSLKFKVSESAPVNTEIPININIEDKNGNIWNSSLYIKVY